jgi:uncharacterized protein (TIGR02246 family)
MWKTRDMDAKTPDDIHRLFAEGLNAGNAEAVAALYEEEAILVPDPKTIVRGREAILDGLKNFLAIDPTMTLNAARVVRNGDIAILYSDWTIKGKNPNGSLMTVDVRPTHVVRRQADGSWKVVIDDPSVDDTPPAA